MRVNKTQMLSEFVHGVIRRLCACKGQLAEPSFLAVSPPSRQPTFLRE